MQLQRLPVLEKHGLRSVTASGSLSRPGATRAAEGSLESLAERTELPGV